MVNSDTTRLIAGILGNIISCLLFLSPIHTFIKIIKEKDVKDFKFDPYIATLLNCSIWFFYGLPFIKPDSTLVLTINGIGFVIESAFITIFFLYSPSSTRKKLIGAILCEIAIVALIIIITIKCFHTPPARATFVGILCIIFNIIMYASPLTVMKMVIQTKSVKYMPFPLSLANFCNGIVWLIYALLKFDINILVPNALGAISGFIQLVLYGVYYKSTKWDDDDDPKSEVQLSRV